MTDEPDLTTASGRTEYLLHVTREVAAGNMNSKTANAICRVLKESRESANLEDIERRTAEIERLFGQVLERKGLTADEVIDILERIRKPTED